MSILEHAPAKINLGLKVVEKRSDGFHDILSVFQTITLFDTLELKEAEKTYLTCDDPSLSCGPENLVLQAEYALRTVFPSIPKTHFHLTKRIPTGGGLGGGSSDAAAAFRGLLRLYNLTLDLKTLEKLSAHLGSDIPFLIRGGTAIISGRGEYITPIQWPFDLYYIIVNPQIFISTAWAYRNLDRIGQNVEQFKQLLTKLKKHTFEINNLSALLVNDFELPVFNHHAKLDIIKQKLLSNGAKSAVMTGSGSCVIGVFDSSDKAQKCHSVMTADGFEAFNTKTYNRT